MFDFLSNQILSVMATRRPTADEGPPTDVRRAAEFQASRMPVARGATTEDQVFLSGAVRLPPPPTPVKPSEPTETGNRVRDLLRRLKGQRRNSRSGEPIAPEEPTEVTREDLSAGHRFDRWA